MPVFKHEDFLIVGQLIFLDQSASPCMELGLLLGQLCHFGNSGQKVQGRELRNVGVRTQFSSDPNWSRTRALERDRSHQICRTIEGGCGGILRRFLCLRR